MAVGQGVSIIFALLMFGHETAIKPIGSFKIRDMKGGRVLTENDFNCGG